MADNTRHPFNPSPVAVKLARQFERNASVTAFQTLGDIILTVQGPLIRSQARRLYETFYAEVGDGTSATVLKDRVEIKMPKAIYDQRFTPVC